MFSSFFFLVAKKIKNDERTKLTLFSSFLNPFGSDTNMKIIMDQVDDVLYGGVVGPDEKKKILFVWTNYDFFGRICYFFGRITYLLGRIMICSKELRFVQTNYLFVQTNKLFVRTN